MTLKYSLPPLENGDRLTRDEFERRYAAMPHLKKAELIEGIVYVASPVRVSHSQPHAEIMAWLGFYKAVTPGVLVYDNPTVRLDGDNEPQPDAVLRLESGGNSRISEDGYIEGAPELVVEIAASSAAYDLHDKLRVYRRNGIQEYLVWCTYDRQIHWFSLEAGEYQPLVADTEAMIRSRQFPGLWLAPEALLTHDLGTVLQVLQQGIATPEHQAFVQILTET
ncbi:MULTISPECIES: Uma2 family endonuclease [unclassified Thermosynechococcus]|uniref:Uma2 family endonuclease n=1 Tax=unclassified Thermosynechococcus TaxID=2622553 RepID=UPI0026721D43|nr:MULTISPECIES: Uma2 family endonuclease [unclassified Thermosynechococcus]MDR7922508.1 Uma2 family endonuclease [Thermosynechococcus sp. HY213]WKT80321.1 Uma2 family endonuclease [Thermosynechococcus sp. PP45]WNC23932.1 Uma2 family endonuclease [Thermosynechococcus sp. PP551]WNC26509.1 Uma2 family endonuclease [Thermosynechococcus sp. PP555]WNC29073.1 Uma2 family endonuclease [Thermosynechococcus sp. PKX82]